MSGRLIEYVLVGAAVIVLALWAGTDALGYGPQGDAPAIEAGE